MFKKKSILNLILYITNEIIYSISLRNSNISLYILIAYNQFFAPKIASVRM